MRRWPNRVATGVAVVAAAAAGVLAALATASAASPGIRLSPAAVDCAAVPWQPSQVAPRRTWAAWSNRMGIVSAG